MNLTWKPWPNSQTISCLALRCCTSVFWRWCEREDRCKSRCGASISELPQAWFGQATVVLDGVVTRFTTQKHLKSSSKYFKHDNFWCKAVNLENRFIDLGLMDGFSLEIGRIAWRPCWNPKWTFGFAASMMLWRAGVQMKTLWQLWCAPFRSDFAFQSSRSTTKKPERDSWSTLRVTPPSVTRRPGHLLAFCRQPGWCWSQEVLCCYFLEHG